MWHQNRAWKSWQLLVYQLDWFFGHGKKLKPLFTILFRFVWIWCYFYYTIYSAVYLRFGVNKIVNKALKWFSIVNMDTKCWFKSCRLLHARERLYRAFIVFSILICQKCFIKYFNNKILAKEYNHKSPRLGGQGWGRGKYFWVPKLFVASEPALQKLATFSISIRLVLWPR